MMMREDEGDRKGPHPTFHSTPALTMTADVANVSVVAMYLRLIVWKVAKVAVVAMFQVCCWRLLKGV